MTAIPRDLVARLLSVSPDTLPPGDLPVARLAELWIGWYREAAPGTSRTHPDEWTFDLFDSLAREAPGLCLDTILAVLPMCRTAAEVAFLAAGPLEDVFCRHAPDVIDRIEAEARRTPRLRYALTGVWPQDDIDETPLWQRLEAARRGPQIGDNAPLPPA